MIKSFCLNVVLLCSFHLCTNAQTGYLDLSFSEDGIIIPDLGSTSFEIIYEATLQADGKILLAGVSSGDFAVMRILADGTPDSSFGINGIVLEDYIGTSDRGHAILVQPDGRIVIAGQTQISNNGDFAVLRLLPDGTPDSTFGINGWVITDMGSTFEFPNCAALQADGKIVVAGRRTDPIFSEFAMVRYHPDGKVDSLFGNNGIVATDLREEDEATAIVIEPDGQIILAGYASVTASGDFALTRYNADGTLDKFFGEGGKVLTDLEGFNSSDFIKDMVLLPDGKILVAGNANNKNTFESPSDVGMARYDENGILDPEFGTGGIYIGTLGSSTDINAMAVQPDGKILLGGNSNALVDEGSWLLVRYHANGTLDTGFGNAGLIATDLPGTSEAPLSLLIQPDSRVIMAGYSGTNPTIDFTAARYITDFVLSYTVNQISCHGANDGSITVDASGGVAPYGYSIDGITFQSENIFTDLPPGTYTIIIKDSNGPGTIAAIGPIVISEPVMPIVDVAVVQDVIIITVIHVGIPPYTFSIDGGSTFSTTDIFPDLNDGTYHIIVNDGNGCLIHNSFATINLTATHDPGTSLTFAITPNPASGQVRFEMNNTSTKQLQIRIMDMTGRIVYTTTIKETGPVIRKFDLKFLDNGVYHVWVGNDTSGGTKKLVIAR